MAPGYEHDFLIEEKKDDEFYCAICQHNIKEATHDCEAHVFCKECIHLYIQKSNSSPIPCPGGCRIEINPSEHHLSHCENRPFPCHYEGCDLSIKRKDLEKHMEECVHKPIVCAHCNNLFPRKFMESRDSECLKKVVQCPYYNVGCQYQNTRDSMKLHIDMSVNHHIELSNRRISNLEDENSILKEKNRSFKVQISELQGEVVALKKQKNDYEKKIDIDNKEQKQLLSEIKELKRKSKALLQTNKEWQLKLQHLQSFLVDNK